MRELEKHKELKEYDMLKECHKHKIKKHERHHDLDKKLKKKLYRGF